MSLLRRPCCAWSAALALLSILAFAGEAAAATITVNTEDDQLANDGRCTLREAISSANTNTGVGGCAAGSGTDTIRFSVAHPKLSRAGAGENANSTGDLDLLSNLTISGKGAGQTTIDADGIDRVFDVAPGRTVTIEKVAITGGKTPTGVDGSGVSVIGANGASATGIDGDPGAPGGGVLNRGTLTLRDARVTGNLTGKGGSGGAGSAANGGANQDGGAGTGGAGGAGGPGGGVFNSGTLAVVRTSVTQNETGGGADGGGGFGGAGGSVAGNSSGKTGGSGVGGNG